MGLYGLMVPGKASDENDHVFHLFVRPKDPKAEQWDGARSGTQAAQDIFNADEVMSAQTARRGPWVDLITVRKH